MEFPRIPIDIAPGDRVIATRNANSDDPTVVVDLVVETITATQVTGGPELLGPMLRRDWELELVAKGNPGLPSRLSEIAAITVMNQVEPLHLLGRGDSWQVDGGGHIDTDTILAWMPWSQWEPILAQYFLDREAARGVEGSR